MNKFYVLALAKKIGTDKNRTFKWFKSEENQAKFNYEYNQVYFVEEILKDFTSVDRKDDLNALIDAGNDIRSATNFNGALALKATINIINVLRNKNKNNKDKTQVFVVSSLKHSEEVQVLKKVFGSNFFLIGLYSSEEKRASILQQSKLYDPDRVEQLFSRDKDENMKNGQQLDRVLKKSDFFIDVENEDSIDSQLTRFFNLLFAHPFCTPTPDEYFMYLTYGASTRSACITRQVGAVIVSENNELISIGCNEVSKYGGGQYWPHDSNDQREFKFISVKEIEGDSSRNVLGNISQDIYDRLLKLNPNILDFKRNKGEILNSIKSSTLSDIVEYYREEHAEAEAIISCARNGYSTRNAKIYSTTFPCHYCAKQIVSAGIKQVIYIEPYLKSKIELFDDSITLKSVEQNKVTFKQFIGVGPNRFYDLFSASSSSGSDLNRGKTIEDWENEPKIPRFTSNTLLNIIANFQFERLPCRDKKYQELIDEMNKSIEEYNIIRNNAI